MNLENGSDWMLLGRAILSLGLVVSLIFLLSWVFRRFLNPEKWSASKPGGLKIKQTFAFEPKKKLMVVEVENKRLLLGVSESQISFLCQLSSHRLSESTPSPTEEVDYGSAVL